MCFTVFERGNKLFFEMEEVFFFLRRWDGVFFFEKLRRRKYTRSEFGLQAEIHTTWPRTRSERNPNGPVRVLLIRWWGGLQTAPIIEGSTRKWAVHLTSLRCIHTWKKSIFPPTLTQVRFSSLNFKTGQTTFLNFSNRAFYLPRAVLKAVLLQ
jgi:hypothetical protein